MYSLEGTLISVFLEVLGLPMAHKDLFIIAVNPLVYELQCLFLLMKAVAEKNNSNLRK